MKTRDLAKYVYGNFLLLLKKVVGADNAKKMDALLRFKKHLNLKNPTTLPEKIIYLENHCSSGLTTQCTDKWAVRQYVSDKGYPDILVPVYGSAVYNTDDLNFDLFPEKFVLKATHGCKMNYLVDNKNSLDIVACKRTLNKWINTVYGAYSGEWHYINIKPRIYCEQYLEDADKMVDYKFHCLNGIPQFLLVFSDRDASGPRMSVSMNLYDMDWNNLNEYVCGSGLEQPGDGKTKKPAQFDRMKEIAEKLSEDFDFVRVDLYEIEGKVFFGELTFTPATGVLPYFTDEFNRQMGKLLTIHSDEK